jgi:lipopolysaccharide/colanic/teichoic acid biosynthesis glycosyltransferase
MPLHNEMMKRCFDIVFSLLLVCMLCPLWIAIAIVVSADSRGGAFFRQTRVGKNGKTFRLWKFRTMRPMSESAGQLTVGANDMRITRAGKTLRKYKVDELPQLFNVLIGDMSMVGPRPEVPKYVAMYTAEQRRVLTIRPGITDQASLMYFEENDLLAQSDDPEKTYIHEIMPAKLELNLRYLDTHDLRGDMVIILRTVQRMFS